MAELITVSVKIPKKLDDDLEDYMKENGYATKTEVFRELLRGQLYKTVENMRGALKGEVRRFKGSDGDWRRQEWKKALKKAGGDAQKAAALLDKKEKKALSDLRL
ncbi:hypothetical protein HZC09_05540 [Candidatus Micrarchaeota archaeon]|nr:hypothetical protein [Candidatus Micrarchaeota archaeon]